MERQKYFQTQSSNSQHYQTLPKMSFEQYKKKQFETFSNSPLKYTNSKINTNTNNTNNNNANLNIIVNTNIDANTNVNIIPNKNNGLKKQTQQTNCKNNPNNNNGTISSAEALTKSWQMYTSLKNKNFDLDLSSCKQPYQKAILIYEPINIPKFLQDQFAENIYIQIEDDRDSQIEEQQIKKNKKFKQFCNVDDLISQRIFYYNYLKLCFETDLQKAQQFLGKIQEIFQTEGFMMMFPDYKDQRFYNNQQFQKLIYEFLNKIADAQFTTQEGLIMYPIMDQAFTYFFFSVGEAYDGNKSSKRSSNGFKNSNNNQQNQDQDQDWKDTIILLSKIFEIQVTIFQQGLYFSDTGIWIYQQPQSQQVVSYQTLNLNNENKNKNKSRFFVIQTNLVERHIQTKTPFDIEYNMNNNKEKASNIGNSQKEMSRYKMISQIQIAGVQGLDALKGQFCQSQEILDDQQLKEELRRQYENKLQEKDDEQIEHDSPEKQINEIEDYCVQQNQQQQQQQQQQQLEQQEKQATFKENSFENEEIQQTQQEQKEEIKEIKQKQQEQQNKNKENIYEESVSTIKNKSTLIMVPKIISFNSVQSITIQPTKSNEQKQKERSRSVSKQTLPLSSQIKVNGFVSGIGNKSREFQEEQNSQCQVNQVNQDNQGQNQEKQEKKVQEQILICNQQSSQQSLKSSKKKTQQDQAKETIIQEPVTHTLIKKDSLSQIKQQSKDEPSSFIQVQEIAKLKKQIKQHVKMDKKQKKRIKLLYKQVLKQCFPPVLSKSNSNDLFTSRSHTSEASKKININALSIAMTTDTREKNSQAVSQLGQQNNSPSQSQSQSFNRKLATFSSSEGSNFMNKINLTNSRQINCSDYPNQQCSNQIQNLNSNINQTLKNDESKQITFAITTQKAQQSISKTFKDTNNKINNHQTSSRIMKQKGQSSFLNNHQTLSNRFMETQKIRNANQNKKVYEIQQLQFFKSVAVSPSFVSNTKNNKQNYNPFIQSTPTQFNNMISYSSKMMQMNPADQVSLQFTNSKMSQILCPTNQISVQMVKNRTRALKKVFNHNFKYNNNGGYISLKDSFSRNRNQSNNYNINQNRNYLNSMHF